MDIENSEKVVFGEILEGEPLGLPKRILWFFDSLKGSKVKLKLYTPLLLLKKLIFSKTTKNTCLKNQKIK
jgi:hypothetical protein